MHAGSEAREVSIDTSSDNSGVNKCSYNIIVGWPTSLTACQNSQIFKVAFIGAHVGVYWSVAIYWSVASDGVNTLPTKK